jgi:hypothetical protein
VFEFSYRELFSGGHIVHTHVVVYNSTCIVEYCYYFFFLRRCGPTRSMASSCTRFLDHTQRHTTVSRTHLNERSGSRRDIYLTTHNTHIIQTSMPPAGFRAHNLNRRAAADLRLRPCGHWNRLLLLLKFFICIMLRFIRYSLIHWSLSGRLEVVCGSERFTAAFTPCRRDLGTLGSSRSYKGRKQAIALAVGKKFRKHWGGKFIRGPALQRLGMSIETRELHNFCACSQL